MLTVVLGLVTALAVNVLILFTLDEVDRAQWHEAAIVSPVVMLATLGLGLVVRAAYRPSAWFTAELVMGLVVQLWLFVAAVDGAGSAPISRWHPGVDGDHLLLAALVALGLPTSWPLAVAALAGRLGRLRGR